MCSRCRMRSKLLLTSFSLCSSHSKRWAIQYGSEEWKLDCACHFWTRWISPLCLFLSPSPLVSLSVYDTVSVLPSISLSSLCRSLPCLPLSAGSIYWAVSLSHVCRPCQQNAWQTVFISMLKDARPAWQLWELSTGICQSPPCRKAVPACLLGWQPFWGCLFDSDNGDVYAALL